MKTEDIYTCPFCDSSDFDELNRRQVFTYKNKKIAPISAAYSKCSGCGFEVVSPEQMKDNWLKIVDKYRQQEDLLTSYEIRSIRELYDLSQVEASRIFGGGPNSFSKYESGKVIQSVAMDRLLRCVQANPDFFECLTGVSRPQHRPTNKTIFGYRNIEVPQFENSGNVVPIGRHIKIKNKKSYSADHIVVPATG